MKNVQKIAKEILAGNSKKKYLAKDISKNRKDFYLNIMKKYKIPYIYLGKNTQGHQDDSLTIIIDGKYEGKVNSVLGYDREANENDLKNIQKIAKEILATKFVDIKPDQFSSNEELAKFLEKQPIDVQFAFPIYNLETGEVLLDLGKRFGKYEHYSIPKKLRGQSVKPRGKEFQEDPRKNEVINFKTFQKYYRIQDKGNGVFIVSRTDLKPFEKYDVENIDMEMVFELKNPNYLSAVEQYKYDEPSDLKTGLKYYTFKPIGINKKYVLENFEDFYNIETKPLRTWFEEDVSIYSEYDGDAEIPVKIMKKDNTTFTKDDLDVIQAYLKRKNNLQDFFGGAEVELHASPGTKVLTETNLMMSMVR